MLSVIEYPRELNLPQDYVDKKPNFFNFKIQDVLHKHYKHRLLTTLKSTRTIQMYHISFFSDLYSLFFIIFSQWQIKMLW